jgi:hypothetical protein
VDARSKPRGTETKTRQKQYDSQKTIRITQPTGVIPVSVANETSRAACTKACM